MSSGVFTKAKMLMQQAIRPVVRVLVPGKTRKQREAEKALHEQHRKQRRDARRARRRWARRAPRSVGYQCPRCWKWLPTPEARLEHRRTEHKPKHAIEDVA